MINDFIRNKVCEVGDVQNNVEIYNLSYLSSYSYTIHHFSEFMLLLFL